MAVELWFPVPIMIYDVEPAVRDATRKKIGAYLETEAAKRDVAPVGFESLDTSYFNPRASIIEDANLAELHDIVLRAGFSFLEGMGVAPVPRLRVERAWINVFRPGSQESQHSHDGSLVSATYYVEAPENCGHLVFPDPVGERRAYRAFTDTIGKTCFTMPEVGFKPEAGRLIMFESWLQHSVQCNKSAGTRVSLAFNLARAAQA